MNHEERIERFTVPTLEQLAPLRSNTVDDAILEKVRAVLAREVKPEDASEACAKWLNSCFNRPCWQERAITACDDLLGTCGVEALEIEGAPYYNDGVSMCAPFSYCNAGDTYRVTLARDHDAGQWVIACWGDLLEEYEQENKLGDCEEFDEEPDRCPCCHATALTLTHFPGSGRGSSYSWVCDGCNHHAYAVEGYEPSEGEAVECHAFASAAPCNADHNRQTVECTRCGIIIIERDSWGDGDIGDDSIPSFCSEACYQIGIEEQDDVEPDEDDDSGDVPGTGNEGRPREPENREAEIRRLMTEATAEGDHATRDLCALALDYTDESRAAYEAAEQCAAIIAGRRAAETEQLPPVGSWEEDFDRDPRKGGQS